VASLAGKANSISTIYMLDIHKKYFNPNLSEKQTVWIGRIAIVVAFVIALIVSPLLANFGQAFEYIQVYTGYISPGILSIFLLGFFWKKATANGALTAAVLSVALSAVIATQYPDFPFMNRMGVVFWICSLVHIAISLIQSKGQDQANAFEVRKEWFRVTPTFRIGAVAVTAMFCIIYYIFW
jgi:SSS family solute:Na+ symporter